MPERKQKDDTAAAEQIPFRQQTFSFGADPAMQWDKALEMAANLEDEELIRKMAQRNLS